MFIEMVTSAIKEHEINFLWAKYFDKSYNIQRWWIHTFIKKIPIHTHLRGPEFPRRTSRGIYERQHRLGYKNINPLSEPFSTYLSPNSYFNKNKHIYILYYREKIMQNNKNDTLRKLATSLSFPWSLLQKSILKVRFNWAQKPANNALGTSIIMQDVSGLFSWTRNSRK